MPQRSQRCHGQRRPCREKRRAQDGAGEDDGHRDEDGRIEGRQLEQHLLQIARQHGATGDARGDADRRQQQHVADDRTKHLVSRGAQRHPNADLTRSTTDGEGNAPVNADNRKRARDQRKQPEHSRVEARLENRVRKDLFHGRDAVGCRLRIHIVDDPPDRRDQTGRRDIGAHGEVRRGVTKQLVVRAGSLQADKDLRAGRVCQAGLSGILDDPRDVPGDVAGVDTCSDRVLA